MVHGRRARQHVPWRSMAQLFGSVKQLIKWIPKGARGHCAPLLSHLLKSVTDNPTSGTAWVNLLSFATQVLAKPSRGGKSKNLSNIIAKRCKDFHLANDDELRNGKLGYDSQEETSGREGRRKKKSKSTDPLGNLAKLVSLKLEEGNYKGAVRLISSEDVFAIPSAEALQTLQDKHPQAHKDR